MAANGWRPRSSEPSTSLRKARATASAGPDQPPFRVWRNRRAVGYQGLSSRPLSQRQSLFQGSSTQTGRPSAPARWATAVSTATIRSSASTAAAVSAKLVRPSDRSMTGKDTSILCRSASPTWRENSATPGTAASGARADKGMERMASA